MSGRGRGSNLSLTQEQLQALGVARGDAAPTTLAPPPLFPKLETKPLPLTIDASTDYMLIVKDQFIEYLRDSPAFVKPKLQSDGIERYSDKYRLLALDTNHGKVLNCVWSNIPIELRPQANRVRVTRKRKLNDPVEIDKRLQTLEKKELLEETEENAAINDDDAPKPTGEANDDEELVEEEEQQDEEIDDGTDYANNYFDNGEDYEEEDDTLDDGPVY